jgi:hypothetical protein
MNAMPRFRLSRSELTGLLTRPPCTGTENRDWAALVVDPVRQIEALADLRDRGLLSPDEFESQMAKVLQR